MDTVQETLEARAARVQSGTDRGGLEQEAHLHIDSAELGAGEPIARCELRFHVVEMELELGLDEAALRLARDHSCEGLYEERRRRVLDAIEHEFHQQWRHRRAFGVVHP